MLDSGQAGDLGIFAGTAKEIRGLPGVPRKPHDAKRTKPFNGLCAMACHEGWRVDLAHFTENSMEIPAWVLRVIRNPAGDPAHWQIAHASSRESDLRHALPKLVAAVHGQVAAWR